MPSDIFQQRKKDVLNKQDKSHIGEWDKHIIKLCDKINQLENYYTTSSCSGRIVIMLDKEKKGKDLFIKVYHDVVDLEKFMKELSAIVPPSTRSHLISPLFTQERRDNKNVNNFKIKKREMIKFKQEPPIIHVACRSLEDADFLLKKAQLAGFKKSGLISIKGNIILELNSTERIEFLLTKNEKLLVNNQFLELIIKKCNDNLQKGWEKIERLEGMI